MAKKFNEVCTDPELIPYNAELEEEGIKLLGMDGTDPNSRPFGRIDAITTALMARIKKAEEIIEELKKEKQ